METLFHRIVGFLSKFEASQPELTEIFDAHPEHVRRILHDARRAGAIVPTGRWHGKAPMYRAKGFTPQIDSPDVAEYKRQVREKMDDLFSTLYSRPAADVRNAIKSIVHGAVSEIR